MARAGHPEKGVPQVLIVRDTRESGEMLESAIAAGVTAAGGDALLGGVLPTPAAPLLVRRHGLQLAAVISASHNSYEDNGIKLFAADGYKLDDDTEHAIEAARSVSRRRSERPERIGHVRHRCTARWRTTCASCTRGLPDWTSAAAGCCWTAPTGPRSARRRRSSGGWGPTLTVIADRARRAQHQRRLWLHAPRGADANASRTGGFQVGVRLRRRRRPSAGGRRGRRGGRRRRARGVGGAAPAAVRIVCPGAAWPSP